MIQPIGEIRPLENQSAIELYTGRSSLEHAENVIDLTDPSNSNDREGCLAGQRSHNLDTPLKQGLP